MRVFVEGFIADMNHLSGVFLLVIAWAGYCCWVGVRRIHSELECLHEDYNRVTHAHDILASEREAKLDSAIAPAIENQEAR